MRFSEFEACVAAGLDLWKWESGLYTTKFMAYVVTWKNLHDMVEMHQQDAVAQKQEEESRSKA